MAQEKDKSAPVPLWAIGLILWFGFDDIMRYLRNPLSLFFILLFGGVFVVLHSLNLLEPVRFILLQIYYAVLDKIAQANSTAGSGTVITAPISSGNSGRSSSGAPMTEMTSLKKAD